MQVKDLKNILCALAKEASNKDKLLMKRYFALLVIMNYFFGTWLIIALPPRRFFTSYMIVGIVTIMYRL